MSATPDLPEPEDDPELEVYERPTMPWERNAKGPPASAGATAGLELLAAVLLFGGVGWWLDSEYGTSPWWSLGLAMAGVATGLVRLIRRSLRNNN